MRVKTASYLAVAAVSALFASPALAQDAAPSYTGAYISIFGGYSMPKGGGSDNFVFDRNNDGTFGDTVTTSTGADAFSPGFCNGSFATNTPTTGCARDESRTDYGARLGYDVETGSSLVIGGLIEFNKSEATESTSAFSTTPAAYEITRRLDYAVSARARLGVKAGSRALIYATGGGSYARIKHDFRTTNTANAFTPSRDRDMVWGWQAGGGVEYLVTDHFSIGAEYLYSRYRDNKYSVAVTAGTAGPTNAFLLGGGQTNIRSGRSNLTLETARVVASFRF